MQLEKSKGRKSQQHEESSIQRNSGQSGVDSGRDEIILMTHVKEGMQFLSDKLNSIVKMTYLSNFYCLYNFKYFHRGFAEQLEVTEEFQLESRYTSKGINVTLGYESPHEQKQLCWYIEKYPENQPSVCAALSIAP